MQRLVQRLDPVRLDGKGVLRSVDLVRVDPVPGYTVPGYYRHTEYHLKQTNKYGAREQMISFDKNIPMGDQGRYRSS